MCLERRRRRNVSACSPNLLRYHGHKTSDNVARWQGVPLKSLRSRNITPVSLPHCFSKAYGSFLLHFKADAFWRYEHTRQYNSEEGREGDVRSLLINRDYYSMRHRDPFHCQLCSLCLLSRCSASMQKKTYRTRDAGNWKLLGGRKEKKPGDTHYPTSFAKQK